MQKLTIIFCIDGDDTYLFKDDTRITTYSYWNGITSENKSLDFLASV